MLEKLAYAEYHIPIPGPATLLDRLNTKFRRVAVHLKGQQLATRVHPVTGSLFDSKEIGVRGSAGQKHEGKKLPPNHASAS